MRLAVGVRPRGVRLDRARHTDTSGDRLVDVSEDASRDTAEERGAEGRALLGLGQLERDAKHGRDDLEPEAAARASAGDPRPRCLDTERAKQVERVREAERHALEHRPDERAAIVAQLEPHERAAGVGIGVRRPLAGEVRQEQQPFRIRWPCRGLGDEGIERHVLGEGVVEPLEGAGGREHHAHRLPRVRTRVAEGVDTRLGIVRVGRKRREHDSRGPEHDGERPGARGTDADCRRRLISPTRRDRRPK